MESSYGLFIHTNNYIKIKSISLVLCYKTNRFVFEVDHTNIVSKYREKIRQFFKR